MIAVIAALSCVAMSGHEAVLWDLATLTPLGVAPFPRSVSLEPSLVSPFVDDVSDSRLGCSDSSDTLLACVVGAARTRVNVFGKSTPPRLLRVLTGHSRPVSCLLVSAAAA